MSGDEGEGKAEDEDEGKGEDEDECEYGCKGDEGRQV